MAGSIATLYTVPPAKRFEIRCITAVNRDAVNDAVWYLYLVPSGGTAGVSNILIPGTAQYAVPAGKAIDYDTWKVLDEGDMIRGYKTSGDVTIHIDGALVNS
jgi:hypothetical protein